MIIMQVIREKQDQICCFSWVVDCDDDDGYEKQKKKDKGTEVPVV